MLGFGCAKSDCTRARHALVRVATEIRDAPIEEPALAEDAFARRMRAEIDALDIEEGDLLGSLDAFAGAVQELAEARREASEAKRELAEERKRLHVLEAELDEAHAVLEQHCERDVKTCIARGEAERITGELVSPQRSERDPVRHAGGRVRRLVRRSAVLLETVAAAQQRVAELDHRVERLERRAAGLGLEVGGHCPAG